MVAASLVASLLVPTSALAHLDADGNGFGSATSKGFLGVDRPMRRGTVNDGVSGTYVGSAFLGATECLNQGVRPPPDTTSASPIEEATGWGQGVADAAGTPHEDCAGRSFIFEAGYGGTGVVLCDMEVFVGPLAVGGVLVHSDEPWVGHVEVESAFGPGTNLRQDGEFDDGGFGGACHGRSIYNFPIDFLNDDASCGGSVTGHVFAEDVILGDDVPIIVTCDSGSQHGDPSAACWSLAIFEALPGLVNPSTAPAAAQGMVADIVGDPVSGESCARETLENEISFVQGADRFLLDFLDVTTDPSSVIPVTCDADGAPDTANFGRGGGISGGGVEVPDGLTDWLGNECEGDLLVFVALLVSANPFWDNVDASSPEGADGTGDDFAWPVISGGQALLEGGSGPGDTIIYVPAGGWIDSGP